MNEYMAKFLPKGRKQMKSEITQLYCDIMDNLFHQIPDFFTCPKIGINDTFQKKKFPALYIPFL
jgi:hypothetical protein